MLVSGIEYDSVRCSQVTDPNTKESVALIYSYEQGQQNNGDMGRIGIQIMGPDDTYIAQTSSDISTFWGDRNRMRLGACLKQAPARTHGVVPRKAVPEVCTPCEYSREP